MNNIEFINFIAKANGINLQQWQIDIVSKLIANPRMTVVHSGGRCYGKKAISDTMKIYRQSGLQVNQVIFDEL